MYINGPRVNKPAQGRSGASGGRLAAFPESMGSPGDLEFMGPSRGDLRSGKPVSSHTLKSAGGTVVSLAALLLWSSSVQAAGQYYVDGASPSCSDSGPGSSTAPYCTISAAAGARGGSGTTLNVRPAVYRA